MDAGAVCVQHAHIPVFRTSARRFLCLEAGRVAGPGADECLDGHNGGSIVFSGAAIGVPSGISVGAFSGIYGSGHGILLYVEPGGHLKCCVQCGSSGHQYGDRRDRFLCAEYEKQRDRRVQ